MISSLDYKSIQVNHQLLSVWSTFLTISLEKQYTQLNSAHTMNKTSEMVTLSVIELGGPSKKWLHFEMAKKINLLVILAMNLILKHCMGHELHIDVKN